MRISLSLTLSLSLSVSLSLSPSLSAEEKISTRTIASSFLHTGARFKLAGLIPSDSYVVMTYTLRSFT